AVGQSAEAGLGEPHHVAPVLRGVAQVIAGGEGLVAGAREDAHPHVGIVLELVPDLVQLEVSGRMQRVQPLRPVDGDDPDPAALLVRREFVGHDVPLGGVRSDADGTAARHGRCIRSEALTLFTPAATVPTMALLSEASVTTRRWTRVEYDRLVDLGLFDGERLELLDGLLVIREPQKSPHAATVTQAGEALRTAFGAGWHARIQAPVAL